MMGLNVYPYIEEVDISFYKAQRSVARKMHVLDWIPKSY
jgi:hypothetical protein